MAPPRIAILCVPLLWLMLVAPGACFLVPPVLTVARSTGPAVLRGAWRIPSALAMPGSARLRVTVWCAGGTLACRAMALGDSSHRLARGAAIRSLASAAVCSSSEFARVRVRSFLVPRLMSTVCYGQWRMRRERA